MPLQIPSNFKTRHVEVFTDFFLACGESNVNSFHLLTFFAEFRSVWVPVSWKMNTGWFKRKNNSLMLNRFRRSKKKVFPLPALQASSIKIKITNTQIPLYCIVMWCEIWLSVNLEYYLDFKHKMQFLLAKVEFHQHVKLSFKRTQLDLVQFRSISQKRHH